MAFPSTPRDVVTEIFVNSAWTDISTSVYARDGIDLRRGRPNEAAQDQPSSCQLTLNNSSGNYSPRNPLGAYYGSIGRNTPLRLGIRTITDAFGRSVSSGWGSTDTGQAWSTASAGGTISASDYNVGSGVGTHSVPATSAYRLTYLSAVSYRGVDVRVDVSLPFTDVTGGDVEPANILLRGQSTTNYYMVRLVVNSSEGVTIALMHYDGTILASAVTTSLTHSSSQTLRVRAQAEGNTLRAKVWAASGSEPYSWHVTAHTTTITTAGWIGVRSGVASGNTNTKPIVFSYDNLQLVLPRFAGEVSTWPQRWDISGNDKYAPIQVDGIMRRLGQGSSPVQSTLRRGTLAAANVLAYWPLEDDDSATFFASALGGPAMAFTPGAVDLASYSAFQASSPLPTFTAASDTWYGQIPAYTATGAVQVRFLMAIPSAGITDQAFLFGLRTTGTAGLWRVRYNTGGSLTVLAYADSAGGSTILSSGPYAFAVDGQNLQVSLDLTQSGSDIAWALSTLQPGQTTGSTAGATLTGRTVGQALEVRISPPPESPPAITVQGLTIGHVSARSAVTSIFDLSSELNAWIGETAGARIVRLCGEEGIAVSYVGTLTDTVAMGPQLPGDLLGLIRDAAEADLGCLYEPRGEVGLAYRTRSSLYNQSPTLALDYATGQVSPPFEPTDDDQLTRNDVTVKRDSGSAARAVLTTGHMSTLSPANSGAGRYDTEVTLNVQADSQLADLAGWRMHLGTVDEARYPSVTVDLTASGVVSAALEPQVLALDVGDRLTVAHPPAGQPPDQISQIALGFAEAINLFAHKVTANCAPESAYRILVLDDATYGQADSDASTLASGATSTATSLSVAVSDGTLWTTTGTETPFDIMVGGEQMTVTAISGAASPQTFTVTRSVNGVVKAQSAGTAVRVANPVVLGL